MIKALLVDDKQASVELLKWLIRENCPGITEIKSANSVKDALPLIHSFEPDILFLDIQMPQQSGFDLLNAIDDWKFEVIFTTAYNEFAIQAIRFSALDYLLKPVDATELVKAVDRYKAKKIFAPAGGELYKNFIRNITSQSNRKLALPGTSDIKYVGLDEIVRLQADRNYTKIFFTNGKYFLAAKTLKEYEEILSSSGSFLRIHRMHLINHNFIKTYEKEGKILLKDGSSLEVSRRRKDELRQFLKAQ
jgi:two-component system LytT family response regulator